MHAHHQNEDEMFVPFLKELFAYPENTCDHKDLVKMLTVLSDMVKVLEDGSSIVALSEKLNAYEKIMLPHLKLEEDECLPLSCPAPKLIGCHTLLIQI